MYTIKKVLNHNTVIAQCRENAQEYLLMGKGIGFGKKQGDSVETEGSCSVYSLQEQTDRGTAGNLAETLSPVCMEIADEILRQAETVFGKIDRSILFPMADHLEYAVKRIQEKEEIRNPLTEDIRVLFHMEYKVAERCRKIMWNRMKLDVSDDEIGYIALHIHSAIEEEKVSQAMQIALATRECVSQVEQVSGKSINVQSLSYNRLMNHVRYMVARAWKGEKLKLSLNEYMSGRFPQAYAMAEKVCGDISRQLRVPMDEAEIGYLAMHIERVLSGEIS